jgi:hypothetical protein
MILTTPPLYDRSGSEQKLAGRLAGTHGVFIDRLASLFGGLGWARNEPRDCEYTDIAIDEV